MKATFNLFGEHTRTLGAAEQRRGYTETSNQEDKVRIGMTNSDMTVAYREECRARGITHATGRSARNTKVPKSFPIEHAGIEALKNAVKQHEFMRLNPNTVYNDKEHKVVDFLPFIGKDRFPYNPVRGNETEKTRKRKRGG